MTDLSFSADTPVGTIAEALPGATEVFRRAGIGFCCGGDESLGQAVRHQGGDLDAVLAALAALVARSAAPEPADTAALIDHILARYHDVHREELGWLIPLAEKVECVHGDHDAAPLGLTDALLALAQDLESHMAKEEQVLFPMMRGGGHPMIAHPIAAMRHEHDEADRLRDRILAVTRGLDLPEGACRSWTALYNGLRKFSADLTEHMRLENEVLFPRFDAA